MKTKPCVVCSKPMPKGTVNVCSPKCDRIHKSNLKKAKELKVKEKKQKIKEKKKNSVEFLKKVLWKIVSEYIRRKGEVNGYNRCVTCSVVSPWKKLQAGHFIPAGSSNYLRFEEINLHCQCYSCNVCKHGNLTEYTIYMNENYGELVVKELYSKRNIVKHWTSEELLELIELYTNKLKDL